MFRVSLWGIASLLASAEDGQKVSKEVLQQTDMHVRSSASISENLMLHFYFPNL